MGIFTDHPNGTDKPQTYLEHGEVALFNSIILIWGAFAGITHAFFPWMFKFTTSTIITKIFKKLVDSGRHVDEINRIMPGYIKDEHLNK